jgi:hypothetical protein
MINLKDYGVDCMMSKMIELGRGFIVYYQNFSGSRVVRL